MTHLCVIQKCRLILPAIALLIWGFPNAALCDMLSTGHNDRIQEISHRVRLRFRDGIVFATVRRSFANFGDHTTDIALNIELPNGAVATGLRYKANNKWRVAKLKSSETAKRQYNPNPDDTPRTGEAILMEWGPVDSLNLYLFPLPAQKTRTVEYTLMIPSEYRDGDYSISYPLKSEYSPELADPIVTVANASMTDAYTPFSFLVNHIPIEKKIPCVLTQETLSACQIDLIADTLVCPDKSVETGRHFHARIQFRVNSPFPVHARMGRLKVAKNKSFSRIEVEAARPLADVPEAPGVVFLVDASHSMRPIDRDAQMALIEGFVSHVPDASVEVIFYRRHATQLFGKLVDIKQLSEALHNGDLTESLQPGNGSNIDDAIALATQLLANRRGTGYIVAFSDELLKPSINIEAVLKQVSKTAQDTRIHVVVPLQSWHTTLKRDDTRQLSVLPPVKDGLFVYFHYGDLEQKAQLKHVARRLVRPDRIDYFRIEGWPGKNERHGADDTYEMTNYFNGSATLFEGSGIRLFQMMPRPPKKIVLKGKIWSRPFHKVVTASRLLSKASAGFAFTTGLADALTLEEQMSLARRAHGVTPLTSFVLAEKGDRPSIGRFGGGASGGTPDPAGFAVRSPKAERASKMNWSDKLHPLKAACKESHQNAYRDVAPDAQLIVHTTLNEIVDVTNSNSDNAFLHCLTEAIWQMTLPSDFERRHDTFELSATIAHLKHPEAS